MGLVSGGVHTAHGKGGRGVAMRHSGDQIDVEMREGTHRVDIDLRALSDRVGAICLMLSASPWGRRGTGSVRAV